MSVIRKEDFTHDELIKRIFKAYEKADKQKYANLFLASLSTGELSWRGGLAVLAVMQTFPKHKFIPRGKDEFLPGYCKICTNHEKSFIGTPEYLEYCFEHEGGIWPDDLLKMYTFLLKTNALKDRKPTKDDFRIFSHIINILLSAGQMENVKRDVFSQIQQIGLKNTPVYKLHYIIDTLGYCSILETKQHKGFLHQYTDLTTAPKKAYSAAFSYPVDFWLGKDGVNQEALKFWFGHCKELEEFWTRYRVYAKLPI
ncbi:hypothetical protein [Capnocytophaga haemolytica]|jgi:hypothetical protein